MQPLRSLFLVPMLLGWSAIASASPIGHSSGDDLAVDILARVATEHGAAGIDPLEHRLLADAADGRLDEHSLFQASLLAEGVLDSRQLDRYQRVLDRHLARLADQKPDDPDADRRERARAVFEFLHGELLTGGYRSDSSEVNVALDRGCYNCVSATLLFQCLARELQLATVAVERPGHVLSRLTLPCQTLDIETTCPNWFQRDAVLVEYQQTQPAEFATSPEQPATPAAGRAMTDLQLLAIVYYNRGVGQLVERRFATAVAVLCRAYALDPESRSIRGNLLAAVNNWALDLGGQQRFAEAVTLLTAARSAAPDHRSFQVNYVAVHYAWLERLYAADDYPGAVEVIERAAADSPEEPFFDAARLIVYRRWGQWLLENDERQAAIERFDQLQREHPVIAEAHAAEAAAWNDAALKHVRTRDYPTAVAMLQQAYRRQPASVLLAENYRAAIMHWADEAFAQGDYSEAVRRTQIALVQIPHDADLRGNLRFGYHLWLRKLAATDRRDLARRILAQARRDDPGWEFWDQWQSRLSGS